MNNAEKDFEGPEQIFEHLREIFPDPDAVPTGIWSNKDLAHVLGEDLLLDVVQTFVHEAQQNPHSLRLALSEIADLVLSSAEACGEDDQRVLFETKEDLGRHERGRMYQEMSEEERRHCEGLHGAVVWHLYWGGEMEQLREIEGLELLRFELIPQEA